MHEHEMTTLVRPGGRRVAVHHLADGDSGRTVLLCHSAPGAGAFDPDPHETWGRGVTLLAADRPGYGQSEPLPEAEWPSIAAAADDLAALLDERGGAPAGVAGWSAGGRVALALAARRPDLVDRVVVLATPAPHEAVPWIPPEQQAGIEALREQPAEVALHALREQLASFGAADHSAGESLQLLAAGDADEAALALPGARERLGRMLAQSFAQGSVGLAADIISYTMRPWGFAPQDVAAKALLLYGSRDPVAGQRHGSWWQKQLPQARLEMVPDAGHLVALLMWRRALSFLAPHARRQVG